MLVFSGICAYRVINFPQWHCHLLRAAIVAILIGRSSRFRETQLLAAAFLSRRHPILSFEKTLVKDHCDRYAHCVARAFRWCAEEYHLLWGAEAYHAAVCARFEVCPLTVLKSHLMCW